MRSKFVVFMSGMAFILGVSTFVVAGFLSKTNSSEDVAVMAKALILLVGSLLMFSGVRAGAIVCMGAMIVHWAGTKHLGFGELAAGLVNMSMFGLAWQKMRTGPRWSDLQPTTRGQLKLLSAVVLSVALSIFVMAVKRS